MDQTIIGIYKSQGYLRAISDLNKRSVDLLEELLTVPPWRPFKFIRIDSELNGIHKAVDVLFDSLDKRKV